MAPKKWMTMTCSCDNSCGAEGFNRTGCSCNGGCTHTCLGQPAPTPATSAAAAATPAPAPTPTPTQETKKSNHCHCCEAEKGDIRTCGTPGGHPCLNLAKGIPCENFPQGGGIAAAAPTPKATPAPTPAPTHVQLQSLFKLLTDNEDVFHNEGIKDYRGCKKEGLMAIINILSSHLFKEGLIGKYSPIVDEKRSKETLMFTKMTHELAPKVKGKSKNALVYEILDSLQPVNRVCTKSKGLKTLNKRLKDCGLPELGKDTTDPSLAAAADPIPTPSTSAAADPTSAEFQLPASLSGYMIDMLPEQLFAVVTPAVPVVVEPVADPTPADPDRESESESEFVDCDQVD